MSEQTEQSTEQQESGAEETVEETATETGGTEQQDDAQEADAGKQEKPFDRKQAEAKIRKANSEAANLRKRLKELEPAAAELQRIKDSEKTESERLNDQLTRANDLVTKTRQKLVRSQVQALAMTGFADLDDSGDIDEAAIRSDLDALLERKPHWAKTQPQEGPRRPAPDRTQASGANKSRPPTPGDEFAGWLKPQLKTK